MQRNFKPYPTDFPLILCAFYVIILPSSGYSSVVECQLPKLKMRVRFPLPAPCKKPLLPTGQKRFFTMISVPGGTGDIPCGYDICFADDICLRHMKERISYHACEASISYAVSRISYRVSDISLKNTAFYDIMPLK